MSKHFWENGLQNTAWKLNSNFCYKRLEGSFVFYDREDKDTKQAGTVFAISKELLLTECHIIVLPNDINLDTQPLVATELEITLSRNWEGYIYIVALFSITILQTIQIEDNKVVEGHEHTWCVLLWRNGADVLEPCGLSEYLRIIVEYVKGANMFSSGDATTLAMVQFGRPNLPPLSVWLYPSVLEGHSQFLFCLIPLWSLDF